MADIASDAQALIEQIDRAHDLVCALCKPRGIEGAREWIMSIPARPDYDPDLVIGKALCDARAALAAAQAGAPDPRSMAWPTGLEMETMHNEGHRQGLAAGIEAAEEVARNHAGEIARKIADAIRALRPAAQAGAAAEIARLQKLVKEQGQEVAITREQDEAKDAEIARLNELLRGTGANRYWEGRWRDAEAALRKIAEHPDTNYEAIVFAREALGK